MNELVQVGRILPRADSKTDRRTRWKRLTRSSELEIPTLSRKGLETRMGHPVEFWIPASDLATARLGPGLLQDRDLPGVIELMLSDAVQ